MEFGAALLVKKGGECLGPGYDLRPFRDDTGGSSRRIVIPESKTQAEMSGTQDRSCEYRENVIPLGPADHSPFSRGRAHRDC